MFLIQIIFSYGSQAFGLQKILENMLNNRNKQSTLDKVPMIRNMIEQRYTFFTYIPSKYLLYICMSIIVYVVYTDSTIPSTT